MIEIETRADQIDWQGMRADALTSLGYLELVWRKTEEQGPAEAHEKMVRDIYLPLLSALAEFCASIEVSEPSEEGCDVNFVMPRGGDT